MYLYVYIYIYMYYICAKNVCVYHMYYVFIVLTAEHLLVRVINKLIYLEGAFLQKSSMFGFIQM
jgi:hypothetical protein